MTVQTISFRPDASTRRELDVLASMVEPAEWEDIEHAVRLVLGLL